MPNRARELLNGDVQHYSAGSHPATLSRAEGTATSARAWEADLRRAMNGEVRFGPGDRALYASDSSNYRHVPLGVVIPRSVEDITTAVAICARHGAPIDHRGGGTSLAGQTISPASYPGGRVNSAFTG